MKISKATKHAASSWLEDEAVWPRAVGKKFGAMHFSTLGLNARRGGDGSRAGFFCGRAA